MPAMGNAMMTDWNETARAHAAFRRQMSPDVPRAAETLGPGVSVAFGNDDFACDDRVRAAVGLLRRQLRSAGLTELGFGLSHDERTWAVVVQTGDADALRASLDTAFHIAFGTDA
jgi:hypothetical protein